MKPFDLYRFVMGSQVWTLTSADSDQTYDAGSGSEYYTAVPMGRAEIQVKSDITKNDLEIRLPIDHPLAVSLIQSYREQILSITVFTNRDGSVQTSWKGRLAGYAPSDSYLALNGESIFTGLRRTGLPKLFQRSCPFALYGRGCNIDPETFVLNTTLSAISGVVLTVPGASSQPDGYWVGGMLRDPSGALAYVVAHTGTLLTLQRVPYTLASAFATAGVGMAVKLYPGCDHTRATCWSKFSNGLNYGGFDWIPSKNPMGGVQIT